MDREKESLNDKTWLHQGVRFCLVGASNTVVGYLIYSGVLLVLKRTGLFIHMDYLIAQAAAFILGTLWAFYWNNRVVFTDRKKKEGGELVKALCKSYLMYISTGLLLSSGLLYLWVSICGISEFFAPFINYTITVPLNFLISKVWVYK